jgi:hypothetical protein
MNSENGIVVVDDGLGCDTEILFCRFEKLVVGVITIAEFDAVCWKKLRFRTFSMPTLLRIDAVVLLLLIVLLFKCVPKLDLLSFSFKQKKKKKIFLNFF